jgi:hypothetical protein
MQNVRGASKNHQAVQQVVTVVAATSDMQKQIYLGMGQLGADSRIHQDLAALISKSFLVLFFKKEQNFP